MGLGKTYQAIAIAAYYKSGTDSVFFSNAFFLFSFSFYFFFLRSFFLRSLEWPCLVIVPSSLRCQWAESFFELFGGNLPQEKITVVDNAKSAIDGDIVILSYTVANNMAEKLYAKSK